MNTKIALHLTFIVANFTLMTGCCTQSLIDGTKQVTLNAFSPSAVYQSTNGDGIGLEGICRKHFDYQPAYFWHDQPGFHAYLIIPRESLVLQQSQTDRSLSLEEIKRLPPDFTRNLKPKNKLPPIYKKVADLPKNDIYLDIAPTRPSKTASTVTVILIAPFTFAVDVVTFPIQLPFFLALRNGHT
jgi:hypothetical protein